jgi:hypothetical protein
MDFTNLGTYTLEGAGTMLIVVLAYKVYKLRIASESDCCGHAFRVKTSNRGDSTTDLELTSIRVDNN